MKDPKSSCTFDYTTCKDKVSSKYTCLNIRKVDLVNSEGASYFPPIVNRFHALVIIPTASSDWLTSV